MTNPPSPYQPAAPPSAPKKSRTGMILGLVIGGLALVLLVCGGGGYLVWKNFFDDSPQGAEITGEYGVVEELCGAFDHKAFNDYVGEKTEVFNEEYKPAYDQEQADVDPETSTCALATADKMDGEGRKPLTLISTWFVREQAAVDDFTELKTSQADSADTDDPRPVSLDDTDDAYSAVTNVDGKPLYVTVAAVDANISLSVSVDVVGEDTETALDVAVSVVEETMKHSRR